MCAFGRMALLFERTKGYLKINKKSYENFKYGETSLKHYEIKKNCQL